MNRDEYDSNHPASYRPGRLHSHRNTSIAQSSRNDYDVESMLSVRTLPTRDAHSRWDHRPAIDGHDRRAAATLAPSYKRVASPPRHYKYCGYREAVDYDKVSDPSVRREYSPVRTVEKGRDSAFKGFTTPLPGNDPGYANDSANDRRWRRPIEADRCSARSYAAPPSVSACESYHEEPKYMYRPRVCRDLPYTNDYPPEPTSNQNDRKSRYETVEPEQRFATDTAGSIASKKRSTAYARPWEKASSYDSTPGDHQCPPAKGELILSPRTFKRECTRAYNEAKAQRMRNLEEGLYGKCDWATYDSKYC